MGETARASADAYSDDKFDAELFYINPGVDPLRGSVEVKLRVAKPPAYLRQDMTVSVDIETGRRQAALVAPADAVFDVANGRPWVLIAVDGRATRRAVELGYRGAGHVEIIKGADPGEHLITAPPGVLPGQRVRIGHGSTP